MDTYMAKRLCDNCSNRFNVRVIHNDKMIARKTVVCPHCGSVSREAGVYKSDIKILELQVSDPNKKHTRPLTCDRCGGYMVVRNGPHNSQLYGCENYAARNCRFTLTRKQGDDRIREINARKKASV